MAYQQAGHYGGAPARGYYDQQAPRGAARNAPRPGPRGPPPQQYMDDYGGGYGQEGAYFQGQEQEYHGYDRESFWGAYGGDTSGYSQNYEQEYSYQQHYDQSYNQPQQRRGQPPSRGQMPRGDGYGPPRGRAYSNGMDGQMGPRPGPPPPPQNYGPPRGGMQQYEDRRQMGGGPSGDWRSAPGGERPKLIGGAPTAKTVDQIAAQALNGLDLNARSSTDPHRRPPTSGSVHSQNSSRSNYARHPGEHRGERPPRSSEDRHRGPPGRAMTVPPDNQYPVDNRQFNSQQNPRPEQQYDAGYGQGRRDPIEQRSNTTVGDRPMRAGMQPPRPSTATGMRQQPGMPRRDDFAGEPRSAGAAFTPPFTGPPRPGTSNGVRPPAQARPPDVENWMPDFDAQSAAGRSLRDAAGLPLDGAPEAMKPLTRAATVESPMAGQFAQQAHKSRSQPDFRGQQSNGAAYGAPAGAPMVPPLHSQERGQYPGPRRDGPQMAINNAHNFNGGMLGGGSMPISPRQFHRPGAPPLNRNETHQSGQSDPGPGGPGGPRVHGNSNPTVPSRNPDALPSHPAPVRPGLASGAQPGPAQIRQAQAQQLSLSDDDRSSMPITHQELERLRQAVQTNPADTKQALHFARRLVEASQVLANEGGRADERTTQKNRERYISDAHKQIKRLVSANCAEAMFYLADCYGTGQLGLVVDPKEAFGLYQAAAKLGHSSSAYRTAVCCEMGLEAGGGTRKDPLKAVQWYKRAAALGDTPAMYKLGMILLKGLLGQQASIGEAVTWLQRAADKADEENPHALHELAQLYENAPPGGKIIQDHKYAFQLYQKASKLGYRSSQARLGKAYEFGHLGCQIDNRSSIHWYSKAAAQEDHDAELALSGWYLTGSQGILAASDQEAYLWARKAALAELPKAEFAMGYFSETGIGCPKSLEDAKRWYGRAASHRYPKAQARLEELIRGGGKNLKTRERLSRGDEKKHEDCIVIWIWFTDEAHFQSKELANAPEYELRFPGQERSINEEPEGVRDVTLHVSGGICYNKKGNLQFYKDPVEPSEKVRRQIKEPKQLKYELDSVYQARLKVWQDLKAKENETPKGNCMTQVFYAKTILPQHITAIQALEKRHKRKYWLQEDGDPSHGIKSPNSDPAVIKREADLLLLDYAYNDTKKDQGDAG
ncbi:hypothetical protein FKW77_000373 [Venturia effusa]|uniref:Uncharacterized protein n=1 Tax=Venturia effusa TaxID=50376 RepID=A0A517L2J2_9PEZI|nr:hypothetical protein FKW77_000373 [Venturia effusa]